MSIPTQDRLQNIIFIVNKCLIPLYPLSVVNCFMPLLYCFMEDYQEMISSIFYAIAGFKLIFAAIVFSIILFVMQLEVAKFMMEEIQPVTDVTLKRKTFF